mgnify:CR=1 FL=1
MEVFILAIYLYSFTTSTTLMVQGFQTEQECKEQGTLASRSLTKDTAKHASFVCIKQTFKMEGLE